MWVGRNEEDTHGTDVSGRRRAPRGRRQLRARDQDDAANRAGVSTDSAPVFLQDQGHGPPGTIYAGDSPGGGSVVPGDAGIDCGLYVVLESLSVLNEVARRGRGGVA